MPNHLNGYWFLKIATAALMLSLSAGGHAQAAQDDKSADDSYSATGNRIAYYNTPNRRHTNIDEQDMKMLGSVDLVLEKPSDVLVQFTTQLANGAKAGCPCSVRASLVVDKDAPIVVKRVNLSGGAGEGTSYVPDRQGADGSFVFRLPAGSHKVSLIVQQIAGTAGVIQAFYTNIQAVTFIR